MSSFLLRYKFLVLTVIFCMTVFLGTKIPLIKFAYEEVNLLPKDHPENISYSRFIDIFGDEARTIFLGVKDARFLTPSVFSAWENFIRQTKSHIEIQQVLDVSTAQKFIKDPIKKRFTTEKINKDADLEKFKKTILDSLPFYEGLLFNSEKNTFFSAVIIKKDIVNTKARKKFILHKFIPLVKEFEKETGIEVHCSGMPYVRTLNSQNIRAEMFIFILLTLGVTSLIFYFFFRSARATFITLGVVLIGVIWCFGLIGLLQYEITILTALIPPLIIVIGVPNAIFIINKYQQEIKKNTPQKTALKNVISKVGNATLMTNLTTAIGFFTFIFTKADFMKEFGIIAFVSILSVFVVSITVIPCVYSLLSPPKNKHLKHLDKKWVQKIIAQMVMIVRFHRKKVYVITSFVLLISAVGFSKMSVSGSLLDDMPKNEPFFKDVLFFDKYFGGIMPVEILIDTKKNNGVFTNTTLRKMATLQKSIDTTAVFSKSFSVVNAVKYARQTFYNGLPSYYKIPTARERIFLMPYIKGSNERLENNFVDKTERYARINTQMKDISTDKIQTVKKQLENLIKKIFPSEKYDIAITGKSMTFLTGTYFLIENLAVSLLLAILIISVLMGCLFKSVRMIFISLIPNLLPLFVTAGLMGYLSIPIKPSTILVFSIAFGISVDDTIHFLAKYRQELKYLQKTLGGYPIKKAVYKALKETGISMFYTSIVLFFGFMTLVYSSFGGTKALGLLTAFTLLIAMVANLILLPVLLLSFEKVIQKKS